MKAYTYKEFTDKALVESKSCRHDGQGQKVPKPAGRKRCCRRRTNAREIFRSRRRRLVVETEIKQAIRTAVLSGKFYAVTGGDGRGVIVEKVLDLVNDYLPSPLDRGSTWGTHPKTGDEIERKPAEDAAICSFGIQNHYRPICW
jgi:elongation factor G